MSSVLGVGPSERTTERPEASWPVTMRRGTVDMARRFPENDCSKPRSLTDHASERSLKTFAGRSGEREVGREQRQNPARHDVARSGGRADRAAGGAGRVRRAVSTAVSLHPRAELDE